MTPKQQAYEVTASTIIKNLAKRRMEGFYCPDSRSAVAKALELMPKGCSIAWGGSATVQQTGLMEAIRGGSYQIIDRDEAKTPEEKRVMFSRIVMADYFLMSANAITLDGQLMNIDGNGNRVGPLCYGPEHVLVVAGMNKVVTDIHEGVKRIRAMACPPTQSVWAAGLPAPWPVSAATAKGRSPCAASLSSCAAASLRTASR